MGVMPAMGPVLGAEGHETSWRTCARCRSCRTIACARSSASRSSCRTARPATAPTARATRRRRADLTDEDWLYGSSEATITETVTQGPAQRPAARRWRCRRGRTRSGEARATCWPRTCGVCRTRRPSLSCRCARCKTHQVTPRAARPPAADEESLYEIRRKIYPARGQRRFARARIAAVIATQLVF
jgi:hypothetical protein